RAPSLTSGGDLVTGRQLLLGNPDIGICWGAGDQTRELYRNAGGGGVVYVQSRRARVGAVFGPLAARAGGCVVVACFARRRWGIPAGAGVEALAIEAAGHVSLPARYLTATGQLREGAPFSERDLRPPAEPLVVADDGPAPVLVRSRQGWSRHCHARHPFDVVG